MFIVVLIIVDWLVKYYRIHCYGHLKSKFQERKIPCLEGYEQKNPKKKNGKTGLDCIRKNEIRSKS